MRTTERGLALIRAFESFQAVPYLCPAGYWTIGYGHVIRPNETFTSLGQDGAEALLAQDVARAERSVRRLIHVILSPGQWDALTSFTFNLGGGALQRSTLRAKVNREEHDDVPAEFLKWVWADGRKFAGLIRRRAAEAQLYQNG